jgi:AraC-like DNA-binding protein
VLQLMHVDPAYPWTVDSLARECATSRSLLAARFKAMLGQPPMQYLACWRLQLAAEMLRDGALGIAAIAERAGYESEPAFNRAFKRHAGEPPAAWRDRIRRAAPEANS